jgi:hypothetical protein
MQIVKTVTIGVFTAFLVGMLFASVANAFTFNYSPTGDNITSPVTFNVSFDLSESGILTDTYWCLTIDNAFDLDFYSNNTYPVNAGLNSGTFVFDLPVGLKIRMVYLVSLAGDLPCNADNWNEANLSFYEVLVPPFDPLFETTFLFEVIEIINGNLWGGGGFFGSTISPNDIKTDVQASVIETGANLWGLLVFLGVSLAFIIFMQVVFLTNRSIKPKKPKFDEKKAKELKDYYSKDGGAPKWLVDKVRKKE